jgi:hypothetical protein
VVAILIVFTLSGSSVLFLRPLFFDLIGIDSSTHLVIKIIAYVLFIFPMYQILLLGYGWFFGQKSFFLKKMNKAIALLKFKK